MQIASVARELATPVPSAGRQFGRCREPCLTLLTRPQRATEGERLTFSYRSARSGSLTTGLGLVIVIETVAVDLWLHAPHPVVAWCLSLASLMSLTWLAADYQRLGRGVITVDGNLLHLRVGLRARAEIRLDRVARAIRPTSQDLPRRATTEAKAYRNLTKPASPNVLIVLETPVSVRIVSSMRVQLRQFGLHLDDPDGFLAAIARSVGEQGSPPASLTIANAPTRV